MVEKNRPEYKLGWVEADEVNENLVPPHRLTYEEFEEEFSSLMEAVSQKEKKGGLDPNHPLTYKVMTEEEWQLMAKDWKAFSRSRGFSEEDIEEYERWLILSGQRDELKGAVNDPWRRTWPNHDKWIYLRHIKRAEESGVELSSQVIESAQNLRDELSGRTARTAASTIDVPTVHSQDENSERKDIIW